MLKNVPELGSVGAAFVASWCHAMKGGEGLSHATVLGPYELG
jgi:hypothetical protein